LLKVTIAKYYTPSGRCIQAIDYAHKSKDGSVNKISDSLRAKFKTKGGRFVYDASGILNGEGSYKTIGKPVAFVKTAAATSKSTN